MILLKGFTVVLVWAWRGSQLLVILESMFVKKLRRSLTSMLKRKLNFFMN